MDKIERIDTDFLRLNQLFSQPLVIPNTFRHSMNGGHFMIDMRRWGEIHVSSGFETVIGTSQTFRNAGTQRTDGRRGLDIYGLTREEFDVLYSRFAHNVRSLFNYMPS